MNKHIKELTLQTLRNAQKAYEFCDEPRVSRIAELEAYLKHAEGHAAKLEAENKALRERVEKLEGK